VNKRNNRDQAANPFHNEIAVREDRPSELTRAIQDVQIAAVAKEVEGGGKALVTPISNNGSHLVPFLLGEKSVIL
jgi:hypothetical protein